MIFTHWLAYNFTWYSGAAWSNVWAMLPCGIVAVIWGVAVQRSAHARAELLEELHYLAHTGRVHPRVQERLDAHRTD